MTPELRELAQSLMALAERRGEEGLAGLITDLVSEADALQRENARLREALEAARPHVSFAWEHYVTDEMQDKVGDVLTRIDAALAPSAAQEDAR